MIIRMKLSTVVDARECEFTEFEFRDWKNPSRKLSTEAEAKRFADIISRYASTDFCEALFNELYTKKVFEVL